MEDIIKEDIQNIIEAIKKEARMLEGKTVLVSGGAGFLGSYIVGTILALNKNILKSPCRVVILDNFITGIKDNSLLDTKDQNLKFLEHDVRKPIPSEIESDYVIHAAGLASPTYYQKFPIETFEVGILGTKNFLDFAREKGVKKFLFFSSSEIYGDPNPNFIPTPETYWGNVSSVGPRACYDESKRAGETLCSIYSGHYNIPINIVRPFNVYGPGMKVNDYRVVPTFMVRGLRGETLTVHDKGNQTRTFCYISDAVTGFLKILLVGKIGEIYNIGNDEGEINIVGLATAVNEVLSNQVKIELISYPDSYPAGEPQRRCPDITKARKELGFFPAIDLKTGLQRTVKWYQSILNI